MLEKVGVVDSNNFTAIVLDDEILIKHYDKIFAFICMLDKDASLVSNFVINMLSRNPEIKSALGVSFVLQDIAVLILDRGFEKTQNFIQFIIERPHLHAHLGALLGIANKFKLAQEDFLNYLMQQIDTKIEILNLCKNDNLIEAIQLGIEKIGVDDTRNVCSELFQSRFIKFTVKFIRLAIHAKNSSKDIYQLMQTYPAVEELFQSHAIFDLAFEAIDEIGEDRFVILLKSLINKPVFLVHFASLLSLSIQFGADDVEHLLQFVITENSWDDLKYKADDYALIVHQKRYPERPLDLVIEEFSNQSFDIEFPLKKEEIQTLRTQYEKVKQHEEKLATVGSKERLKELTVSSITALRAEPENEEHRCYLLAIIRQSIKLNFGVYPYNVQMLNVLAFLNEPNHKRIAQIKTGEGKSTVVAILSVFLASSGRNVDIITTSHDLAKRDAEKYKNFFASFDVLAGDIATDEGVTPEYFKPQIIYGTHHDFEFAYLREKTTQEPRRGLRKYDVAIVDEVDSMFIDMQNNSARIGMPMKSGSYKPEVYQCIWNFISDKDAEKTNSLPIEFKKRLLEQWAEFYTHLDNYFVSITRGTDSMVSLETAEQYTVQELVGFWEKHGLNQAFTIKDTSLLHHVVTQNLEELVRLLAKHCPELLTTKNSLGQIPAGLPENKYLTVEVKAETSVMLETKSEPIALTPPVDLVEAKLSSVAVGLASPSAFFKAATEEKEPVLAKIKYDDRFPKIVSACMLKKKEWFDKQLENLNEAEQKEFLSEAESYIVAKKPKLVGAFASFKSEYMTSFNAKSKVTTTDIRK